MKHGIAVCAVLIQCLGSAGEVPAGSVFVPGLAGGSMEVSVKSRKEQLFNSTTRQRYDYSCGSAALATLLTYHYSDPVNEQTVFRWMYDHGDQTKIRKLGFSMLDMRDYLNSRGYKAEGYRITMDQLARASIPAIVLIDLKGYKHFVVIKGVSDKRILLGDSATGIKAMLRPEFEAIWQGLAFVVQPKPNTARRFNDLKEWRVREPAPFGMALRAGELANVTFLLPGPGSAGP